MSFAFRRAGSHAGPSSFEKAPGSYWFQAARMLPNLTSEEQKLRSYFDLMAEAFIFTWTLCNRGQEKLMYQSGMWTWWACWWTWLADGSVSKHWPGSRTDDNNIARAKWWCERLSRRTVASPTTLTFGLLDLLAMALLQLSSRAWGHQLQPCWEVPVWF